MRVIFGGAQPLEGAPVPAGAGAFLKARAAPAPARQTEAPAHRP